MYRRPRLAVRVVWGFCLLALLLVGTLVRAQMGVGDNVSLSLNGDLGFGYSGSFGDTGSGHGLFSAGTGQLSGFYYNPNFLSFDVRPFYHRNQDNGSFASVLSDSGVDMSANIFGGSHFPGSVSFSRSFANGSQYGLPGATGLNADSSTRNFSVTWNELLPNFPSLSATFADNSSSSTIQGGGGTTDTSSRQFSLMSHYRVDGFGLMGFVNHQTVGVTLPTFLSPTNSHSDSSGTSYGISATHALPLSGMFTASYNRTNYSSEAGTYTNNGSTDTADTMVAFQPTERFTVNGEVRYIGNLIGALQQSSLPGGPPPLPESEASSRGLSLSTYGTYRIGHGFTLIGYASRQMQTFQGIETNTTQAGGTLTYSYARPLFGMFYFSFGMVNNATNNGGGNLGFVGNVSLKKQFAGWQVDSDFSYSQNAQTIIASYTTSTYSYGAMVRKRFGASSYWSASYRGIQTGLTQMAGYSNRTDTLVTTYHQGRFGLSGNYSKSHGTALLSSAGVLTPTALAPLISPDEALYNGTVYGAGLSVTPLKRMIVNVNWYRALSDTLTTQAFSANNSERYYGQMQYNLRKLSFRAGYWRVYQGIGANGLPPTTVNTYYFNISRWFNVF
ncbi:MAG TPA: hypothetical protein VLT90_16995 [Terriglobales bacterium]|nr:hypothetical protein [Terriglobales bacterium]